MGLPLWFLADWAGEKMTTMTTTMVFGVCFVFLFVFKNGDRFGDG
jgi:hypothetical protein